MLTDEEKRLGLTPDIIKHRNILWDGTHPFYEELYKVVPNTDAKIVSELKHQWRTANPLDADRNRNVVVQAACKLVALKESAIVLNYLRFQLDEMSFYQTYLECCLEDENERTRGMPFCFPKRDLVERNCFVAEWLILLPKQALVVQETLNLWGIDCTKLIKSVLKFRRNLGDRDGLEYIQESRDIILSRMDAADIEAVNTLSQSKTKTTLRQKVSCSWAKIWPWQADRIELKYLLETMKKLGFKRATAYRITGDCKHVSHSAYVDREQLKKRMRPYISV